MFLMCKDTAIYDIKDNKILRSDLVPRQFKDNDDFRKWKRARLFVESNSASRGLVQSIPNTWIERKRQLSLSDCYWIKHDIDRMTFDEITPYTNNFISLNEIIRNSSLPAETLGGSFQKEWIIIETGERVMRKVSLKDYADAELESYRLACILGLPCNKVVKEESLSVLVYNISDLDWMLLTYLQLGIKVNGYSAKQVASVFNDKEMEIPALKQILFDALVGNNDRKNNMGNFAVLKNTANGELRFPPMFDFNLAHPKQQNLFLTDVCNNIIKDGYAQDAIKILESWNTISAYPCEQNRTTMIKKLQKSFSANSGDFEYTTLF